jgi:hypothetical protein
VKKNASETIILGLGDIVSQHCHYALEIIPTVSLPVYSEQFLALIGLLDSLQAQTSTLPSADTGTGADVLTLKGINFNFY